jgi:hypothetical protein
MDRERTKKAGKSLDKSPYDRHEEKVTNKAFKSVEKSVKPVAKDTNKTRRKETMARKEAKTVASVKPKSNLKKDMHKSMKGKC